VSNQIQVIDQAPAYKPLTAVEMQSQVNVIQQVMGQVMKQDVHYGVIPGTKTPSLYKPGAEKIMATFRLSADPEITDMSDGDQIRYQVKVRLMSPSGVFVGAGIGECSSNEEKYKWRGAICQEEFDETDVSRRREKWNKGRWDNNTRSYGKPGKVQQVRTEPADLANTILKMAKKRALIDAVLTATAASDCFTQDIEDLPPEYIDGEEQPRQSEPAKKAPPKNNAAGGGKTATEGQCKLLRTKLSQMKKTEVDLCAQFGVDAIESISMSQVNDAIAWVTQ
jgi:hypothetical protein